MAEDRIGKDRLLEMYARLAEGKVLYKLEEAEHYKCSLRSIQRDIEDLRAFFHNQSDASGSRIRTCQPRVDGRGQPAAERLCS